MAEQYSTAYMYIFYPQVSIDGTFRLLHDLAIVNGAAVNAGVHVFFLDYEVFL